MAWFTRSSRRDAIKLGALTVGAATFGPAATASAAADPGGLGLPSATTGSTRFVDTVAALTPGTQYLTISGLSLLSAFGPANYVASTGALVTGSGGFTHPLVLPQGAVITELVTYFTKSGAGAMQVGLDVGSPDVANDGQLTLASLGTTSAAPSSGGSVVQTMITSVAPAVVVDRSAHSYVVVVVPAANHSLQGVRVGYTTNRSAFVPVTPGRVFDSRMAVFGAAKIGPGEVKTVSVKDRRSLADGSVDLVDFVPADATAIAYNLTVTDTVGGSFLAVTPGDATTYAASTINWSGSGQSLANGTSVSIDTNRSIKVFSGTGSTHFIIDVVGYYVPV